MVSWEFHKFKWLKNYAFMQKQFLEISAAIQLIQLNIQAHRNKLFPANAPFLSLLKTSENQRFFYHLSGGIEMEHWHKIDCADRANFTKGSRRPP